MRRSYLALTKMACAAAVALASAACGSDEGRYADPDLDIDSSDVAASGSCQLPDGPRTVDQVKGPPENLSGDCVPSWTEEQLNAGFLAIRDRRGLTLPEQPGFDRRIPWLAADNGCEERAETALYFLKEWGYPTPYYARVLAKPRKALILNTINEPGGQVRWSHHVAPVVRVGGQLMILDPAVEPTRPLRIEEWIPRFSAAGEADAALCRDHAKESGCFDAAPVEPPPPDMEYDYGITMRMRAEWGVQELLGRDPYRVLGDCPPWVTTCAPEPTPDPSLPPTIRHFRSDRLDAPLSIPIYVIGDNFVEGVTTVRITGNGINELAPIDDITMRSILLGAAYDPGDYQVTVYNGALASQTVSITVQW
ncbi:protein-glutamine glutaminase family protein [Sorangium sp. So ce1128]